MKVTIEFINGNTKTIYGVIGWQYGDHGVSFHGPEEELLMYIPYRNFLYFESLDDD